MAEVVTVSLVQGRRVRLNKGDPYTEYKPGPAVEMPIEHARALGVLHRVVKQQSAQEGEQAGVMERDPYGGYFDAKLSGILTEAGYPTLDSLRGISRDDLLAIDGVGPAAYERINIALRGA